MKTFFNLDRSQLILKIAAAYSILLGALITFSPRILLGAFNMDIGFGIEFWYLFGAMTVATGLGYFVASLDIEHNWSTILIGLVWHSISFFVFGKSLMNGSLPAVFNWVLLANSAIWLLPFSYILILAFDLNTVEFGTGKNFKDLVGVVRTSQNKTLSELSYENNILLVLVRHLGCPFCKENVAEIAKFEKGIVDKNLTPVFVHMSDPDYGDEFFSRYYNHPVHHISDPTRNIYKSLGVKRGTFSQLYGFMNWPSLFRAWIIKGHKPEFEGDVLQLGGVFVLSKGQIVFEEKSKSCHHLFQLSALSKF